MEVNGEKFLVKVSYGDTYSTKATTEAAPKATSGEVQSIVSPLEGKFYLTNSSSEIPVKVGDVVKKGDLVGYIESMKTYNAISADKDGTIVEICFANGESVDEEDVLFKLQ